MYPFERFTESAKAVLTAAQSEAERHGHTYIGTEHLVVGLMEVEGAVGGTALKNLGLTLPDIRAAVERVMEASKPSFVKQIVPTSRVKRVIEASFEEARRENSPMVGTGQMLVALLIEKDGIAAQVLLDKGVSLDKVRAELARLKEAGVADAAKPTTRTLADAGQVELANANVRQLALADEHAKPITVHIIFPAEYSEQQCSEIASRIERAVKGG